LCVIHGAGTGLRPIRFRYNRSLFPCWLVLFWKDVTGNPAVFSPLVIVAGLGPTLCFSFPGFDPFFFFLLSALCHYRPPSLPMLAVAGSPPSLTEPPLSADAVFTREHCLCHFFHFMIVFSYVFFSKALHPRVLSPGL